MSVGPVRTVGDIAGAVGESAKLGLAVYNDLVSPTAREVGEVAGDATRIALNVARAGLWTLEQTQTWIAAQVKQRLDRRRVSDEKREAPDSRIYATAVLGVAKAGDDEDIRRLFANLLASAMDPGTRGLVHPSFAGIIDQLAPDEGRLLAAITPYADFPLDRGTSAGRTAGSRLVKVATSFTVPSGAVELLTPTRSGTYLNNLARLGLIEFGEPESHRSYLLPQLSKETSGSSSNEGAVAWLTLTPLGIAFWNACVRDVQASGEAGST